MSESCLITWVQCFGDNGDEVGSVLKWIFSYFWNKLILAKKVNLKKELHFYLHWHVDWHMTWRHWSGNHDVAWRARSGHVEDGWAWSRHVNSHWWAWSRVVVVHYWRASSGANDSRLQFIVVGQNGIGRFHTTDLVLEVVDFFLQIFGELSAGLQSAQLFFGSGQSFRV